MVKIAVAGGTGFVGEPLVSELTQIADVIVLSRNPQKVRIGRGVAWDPGHSGEWQNEVRDSDVVINLAGESIAGGRWTEARKQRIAASRMEATRALVNVIRGHQRPDRLLVSASAVGYYGSRGDELLDEASAPGDDFLANVCREWERAARAAEDSARVVITRFGVVLGRGGGALPMMALPFRFLVGGRIGSGNQWMAWVDRIDVIRAIRWAIENRDARGVFNVTAPNPVTNREFTKALGAALHRPAFFPAPAFLLKLVLGEMAEAMLLASQRAVPKELTEQGFDFEFAQLQQSLERALRPGSRR